MLAPTGDDREESPMVPRALPPEAKRNAVDVL